MLVSSEETILVNSLHLFSIMASDKCKQQNSRKRERVSCKTEQLCPAQHRHKTIIYTVSCQVSHPLYRLYRCSDKHKHTHTPATVYSINVARNDMHTLHNKISITLRSHNNGTIIQHCNHYSQIFSVSNIQKKTSSPSQNESISTCPAHPHEYTA